jgi:hypothetical protein
MRLTSAYSDRSETERPGNSCSGCDLLQFHRELLISWLPRRYQGRLLAARWRNGKALTTISRFAYRPTGGVR